MATIWRIMAGQRLRYASAIGGILGATGMRFLWPVILMVAIDHLLLGKALPVSGWLRAAIDATGGQAFYAKHLWIPALLAIGATLLGGVFSFHGDLSASVASESIARRLRDRLYTHLHALPCRYFDDAETGDLVQRCTSDVETLRVFLARQVVEIGRAVILLSAGLAVMLWVDRRMALASMAMIPIVLAASAVFFRRIRATFQRADEAEGAMTQVLQENLTGVRVVRAFARGDHEIEKFRRRNDAYRDHWLGVVRVMSFFWPGMDFLCALQTGTVLIAGGYLVMTTRGGPDEFTIGEWFFFMSAGNAFLWPLRQTGRILSEAGKAVVAIGRVGAILDAEEESDAAEPPRNEPVRGRIEIENLSFRHNHETYVLRDVSVTVEPGQTLAILGPSGSGKSTLVNLLLRLYDYKEGAIRLDGRDLRDLPRRFVRRQFGSVLQEPFLYSRTLRDNIKLGRSSARDEDMIDVAQTAHVHESITSFNQGYDTLVGEKGVTLSGGQRQRVALARALLKNPPLLILDDALSAVDTRTEAMILRALRRRRGRRTTLVIAHRLTTLRHADRILVLENGRVAQFGSHEELMRRDGLYARLWNIQTLLEDDLARIPEAG
jgi:ATP-binding cassette subfamily B protein